MKKSLTKLFLMVIFIAVPFVPYAQVPPPPPGLPVDGGILFLLISGLFYGVVNLIKRN